MTETWGDIHRRRLTLINADFFDNTTFSLSPLQAGHNSDIRQDGQIGHLTVTQGEGVEGKD